MRKSMKKAHKVLSNEGVAQKAAFRRKVLIPMIIVLALGLAVALTLAVLYSPSLSPLSDIHDTDGDGHPDRYDAAPKNQDLWANVSATIMVVIHSDHLVSNYTYDISIDGTMVAGGLIPAGQTEVENITVHFLIGRVSSAKVSLSVTATDGSALQDELVLESGGFYQELFDIPPPTQPL